MFVYTPLIMFCQIRVELYGKYCMNKQGNNDKGAVLMMRGDGRGGQFLLPTFKAQGIYKQQNGTFLLRLNKSEDCLVR